MSEKEPITVINIPEIAKADSGLLSTMYHGGSNLCCVSLLSTACTVPRTEAIARDAGPVAMATAGHAMRHGVTYLSVPI